MRRREDEKKLSHEQRSRDRAEKLEREMAGRYGCDLKIQQPDYEQEEHHDRAGVHDDLQEADDHSVLANKQNGDRQQRRDQGKQRMYRVALDDHAERRNDRQRAEKNIKERRHRGAAPVRTTTNAGSGTLR